MKNPHKETRQAADWSDALIILQDPAFREGYLQASAGRPLCHDHLGDMIEQMRFENGRMVIAHMRSRGIKPPTWPVAQRVPHVLQCVAMDLIREKQSAAA